MTVAEFCQESVTQYDKPCSDITTTGTTIMSPLFINAFPVNSKGPTMFSVNEFFGLTYFTSGRLSTIRSM